MRSCSYPLVRILEVTSIFEEIEEPVESRAVDCPAGVTLIVELVGKYWIDSGRSCLGLILEGFAGMRSLEEAYLCQIGLRFGTAPPDRSLVIRAVLAETGPGAGGQGLHFGGLAGGSDLGQLAAC